MTSFVSKIPADIVRLSEILESSGHEIRIVGGAIRDFLQDIEPKDFDVATTATPDQVMAALEAAGVRVVPTGIAHGTVTAIMSEPIEITTLRIDSDTDGRHAIVEFTTSWEMDAARRDLTFNAMSMDMEGNLHDFFGGAWDLIQEKPQFVGDATTRIREDFLRILRFFRFAGLMTNIVWDPETIEAIKREAMGLSKISGERKFKEINKILGSKSAGIVIQKMIDTGVFDACGFDYTLIPAGAVDKMTGDEIQGWCLLNQGGERLRKVAAISSHLKKIVEFVDAHKPKTVDDIKIILAGFDDRVDDHKRQELVKELIKFTGIWTVEDMLAWPIPRMPVSGADLIVAGVAHRDIKARMSEMRVEWMNSEFTASKEELMSNF